jgi:serine/threonine protein kinase
MAREARDLVRFAIGAREPASYKPDPDRASSLCYRAAYMSDSFGSWQLDALIAAGGVGEIWRATRGDQVAAVKRIHTHLIRNGDAVAQFTREQELAVAIPRHPNLVHGIEAAFVGDRAYVALELAPGEDLRRIVAPSPSPATPAPGRASLPAHRAIAIVLAACEGAAHLHRQGWVHGDINPSNLVVDRDPDEDRVVLIDLGIARPIGEAGTPRGTHAYMAPEQIRGEAWTPATDVFALGVVLWELAAGARLFHRGPPWLSMQAVIEHDPAPLGDPRIDAIARAALAKDPANRLASPLELAERLRGD